MKRPYKLRRRFAGRRATILPLIEAYHRLHRALQFRPIPKGLRPPAQGCEARATLGRSNENTQPQRGCAAPCQGEAATPLGLMAIPRRFPRVARCSQPWALRRYPFGILCRTFSTFLELRMRKLHSFHFLSVKDGTIPLFVAYGWESAMLCNYMPDCGIRYCVKSP